MLLVFYTSLAMIHFIVCYCLLLKCSFFCFCFAFHPFICVACTSLQTTLIIMFINHLQNNADQTMDSAERRAARSVRSQSCCNCHICLAYMLSLIASGIIVHGFYLCYKHHSTVWLVLPGLGVILIFIGSCLYRCGAIKLHRANYGVTRRKRNVLKRAATESQFFESQLSLNMLPQCFSNFDTYTSASHTNSNSAHPYFSLPIDFNPSHSETQLQNLMSVEESGANPHNR